MLNVLAFSAGIFVFCGFSGFKVPRGVKVDGVEVGGLKYEQAAEKIRDVTRANLREKTLYIRGTAVYEFTYPEIDFKDDVYEILKSARRGKSYTSHKKYYLCCADEIAAGIAECESAPVVEPYAEFKCEGDAFEYFEGNDGKTVDVKKLKADIAKSLRGGFEEVKLGFSTVQRTKYMASVKAETKKLASFVTYFDGDNLSRASNIRLAAAKINGTVLGSAKTLSFNDTVGARRKERGFLPAKIIVNGEFVEGIGGGVCQVSTTLYNAALLAGMKIEEYHPHSLPVGYVSPSRDAMVSGSACDLKFSNPFKKPVYIRAKVTRSSVRFDIYGAGDGASYSVKSVVTGSIAAGEELTDKPEKARDGKDGIVSESYLITVRDGYEVKKLLRKDKYLPQSRIILKENDEKEKNTERADNNI